MDVVSPPSPTSSCRARPEIQPRLAEPDAASTVAHPTGPGPRRPEAEPLLALPERLSVAVRSVMRRPRSRLALRTGTMSPIRLPSASRHRSADRPSRSRSISAVHPRAGRLACVRRPCAAGCTCRSLCSGPQITARMSVARYARQLARPAPRVDVGVVDDARLVRPHHRRRTRLRTPRPASGPTMLATPPAWSPVITTTDSSSTSAYGAAVAAEVLGQQPSGAAMTAAIGQGLVAAARSRQERCRAARSPAARLGPLPGGDVAGDLRGADDAALGVADRGDGQGDVERRPSFATRTVSKCSTRSPAAEPLQDRALLVQPLRRDDQGDRLADGLVGRVAEEPLGPGVPRADDAVERLADDGVVGRLDDGRQPRPGLLGPLPLGDVPA